LASGLTQIPLALFILFSLHEPEYSDECIGRARRTRT
jgi:hypothetical protein